VAFMRLSTDSPEREPSSVSLQPSTSARKEGTSSDRNPPHGNSRRRIAKSFVDAWQAMKRSDELNEVELARSGLWRGAATLVVPPSRAAGPLDRQGIVKVEELDDSEFRLAIQLRILTREALTSSERKRLDLIPSDDRTTAISGLYKHILESIPQNSNRLSDNPEGTLSSVSRGRSGRMR
jgi:hypothetical protein